MSATRIPSKMLVVPVERPREAQATWGEERPHVLVARPSPAG
jgi:hypothetical protein